MNTQVKVIKTKVGLLRLAEQLDCVSQACKLFGYSRDNFYSFKELYEQGGEQALLEISWKNPIAANRVEAYVEEVVVTIATERPTLGQVQAANELKKKGICISPAEVRCVWLRHELETFPKRLRALEKKSAEQGLVLSEEQVVALEKAQEENQPLVRS